VTWAVPLTDVEVTDDDLAAVAECLRSGWLTMGPRTKAFEQAVAEWTGAEHAVAVSSATAALHLSLRALEVGEGDEVIVPAFAFVAAAHVARYVGASPVLCDVASVARPTLDPADVARRITDRTRVVVAVHMAGYPADVGALRAVCEPRGVRVVEDAAQAFGAHTATGRQVGTEGELGCLSFFSKAQLSIGEGGMVLTDDEELAARVRRLRSHAMTSGTWDRHRGHEDSYDVVDVGFNYRLDEPRSAFGLARLPRVAAGIARRREVVATYRERLGDVRGVTLMWDDDAVERGSHFAFPVLLDSRRDRDRVHAALRARGVETTHYPAIHELTAYTALAAPGSLPHAEAAAGRHLALPLSPRLTAEQLDVVVTALIAAV
jgi:dTDP-4-amino-4,6-dideoxygalactose transaminase